MKKVDLANFKVPFGDQDRNWSARQPVALSEEIHAPLTTELPEIEVEALSSSASEGEDDETDLFEPSGADCDKLSLFSQSELI